MGLLGHEPNYEIVDDLNALLYVTIQQQRYPRQTKRILPNVHEQTN